ncbi:MAG: hypothetical protein JKY71_07095 [Alphaproteobacteria bacterium]|nr:hypothetical protein [Alphaproteobacteria bacterium]
MADEIKGLDYHPEVETLKSYTDEPPEGLWEGRLDDRAWGRSTNLFCYFTNLETGQKHRLSVFHRNGYKPYKDGPSFRAAGVGEVYRIKTALSKNGLPKFMSAAKREDS